MRAGPWRAVIALAAVGAFYAGVVRPRHLLWGARDDEALSALPGDDVVVNPRYMTTRAVTVHAPPENVWPWLAQMGYQRGGLYSCDTLDRLFGYLDRPSADKVLPEFQHLEAGDVIPVGKGPDWPVHTAEPNRALVLNPRDDGFTVSWAFVINPNRDETSRLISRVRADFLVNPIAGELLAIVLEPAAFLMERSMLLGIKRHAERLASAHQER